MTWNCLNKLSECRCFAKPGYSRMSAMLTPYRKGDPMHRHLLASTIGLATIAVIASAIAPASATIAVPGYARPQAHGRLNRANPAANKYTFMTINNAKDLTFNQLLGINNAGTICGYFGSGATGHPNKGYCVNPPYAQANFNSQNFPGSVQTQVVAIDNIGNTAGFWIDGNNTNFGFIQWNAVFTSYVNPKTKRGTVNQLLGLNDMGIAAGFYVDKTGVSHAYTLNQNTGAFTMIVPPGGNNSQAAGIDNAGDVSGFLTSSTGTVVSYLLRNNTFSEFSFPNSTNTQALGMNNKDQIVGSYLDAAGASHGFVLSHPLTNAKFTTVDDPNGIGTTVVNGTNDLGQLVGFYVDGAGNTNGFLATPT
jgi:hypothetical protein